MDPVKHPPTTEANLHFLDYWRIIRIRKTVIISVFLLIAITSTVVTFILPEYYTSTARIEINQTGPDIPTMSGLPLNQGYDPYFIQTEFSKMEGEDILGRVISAMNLNEAWGKKYNNGAPLKTEDTITILKGRMDLSPERNTKLIDISVSDEDKDEAAQLANAIAEAYQDYRLAQASTNTMGGIIALKQLFQEDEDRIQAVKSNVDQLRLQLNIVDADPNAPGPTPTLSSTDLQRYNDEKIQDEKDYTEQLTVLTRLQSLQATNSTMLRDVLPRMTQDTALADLLSKWQQARQAYVSETNDYGPSSPEVVRAHSMLRELDQEIDDSVNGVMAGEENKVAALKASLDSLTATVQSAISNDQAEAARGAPYWEAKQKLENMNELHKLLQAKITETEVDLNTPKTQMVTIVDQAQPGKNPTKPSKTLYISIGVIVGLLVGIGLAFFIEYLDTSVKTIDDVERSLQAPLLGVIPQNVGLVLDEGAESPHAEAYRVLRTNLLFSRKDEKLNTVAVVSAGAGEGKSTTVFNLAAVFAQSGQRVIMVDSDLRRPTLHKMLRVTNNIGLTN